MKNVTLATVFFLLSIINGLSQEYPVHITEEGYIIIQCNLNDSITGNFILDTGAGLNVISQKMFNKIKGSTIEKGHFTGFRHDADRIDGVLYQTPELSFGHVSKQNATIGIYPPLDNYGIDGLLSLKFFEDHPFTIDFKNKKLIFNPKIDAKKQSVYAVPILIKRDRDIALDIFIEICIDNIEIQTLFDTGHGYGPALLNPYYKSRINLGSDYSESVYTTPLTGRKLKDLKTVSDIGVCGSSFNTKQKVILREGLIYEGLIGSALFKDKAVTIDLKNRIMLIH